MSKKSLYLAVKEALKIKLPDLFIDLQKGQFLKPSENLPVPLPAALVEIYVQKWDEHSKKAQKGEGTIRIELYLDNRQNTFDESELETETIEMLDASSDVFKAVNGLTGDKFEYIERTAEQKPKYDKDYVCFAIEFKFSIIENYG